MGEVDRFGFGDPDGEDSVAAPVVETEQPEITDGLGSVENYDDEATTEYEVEGDDESPSPVKEAEKTKKLYTPDEIKSILKSEDFKGIDTSRLSEEGQAVMRAMQAGLTPKLQESAELKRELQQIRSMIEESKPKPKPKTIEEAFDQNPEETLGFLNKRVQELINDGADLHEIEKIREIRLQLRDRQMLKQQEQAQSNSYAQQLVGALYQAVPDINTKAEKLRDFAIEYMGMTPQELEAETSLKTSGQNAIKMIARINSAYEKMNAGKTAKAKAKAKPTSVEKPGTGFDKPTINKKELFKQARETGDWKSYFLNMEE